MSAYQRETTFLREVIAYDDTAERHRLEETITQAQRDECCVRCAVWLMVLVIALAVTGLGYCAVFLEDFPGNNSQLVVRLLFALALGALISLLVYVGFWVVYRRELDRRQEECRRLVALLLESRLGKPRTRPIPVVVKDQESLCGGPVNAGTEACVVP
ncbi:MAG: hypothetical protein AAB676_02240 [Verrucomicrobiota bacterium]